MRADAACGVHGGETVVNERVLVKEGRLQDVFVYVQKGLEAYQFAPPSGLVTIENKDCLYRPRVSGAQTHQLVRFSSSDSTVHNVKMPSSANYSHNFSLYRAGETKTLVFCHPEVAVKLECDRHGWMEGYLAVVDHPYFCVTDEHGEFAFQRKLPPGRYTVRAWHAVLGHREKEVSIDGGIERVSVEFQFDSSE
jgi:hypothetical protein